MDRSNIGRPKGPMNEAAWRRKAFGKPLRSKAGLIWGRPPSGETDHSDIGRPKGSMNEAAWRRKAVDL